MGEIIPIVYDLDLSSHLTLVSAIPHDLTHFLLPPFSFPSFASNKEISHGFYIKIKFVHVFFYIFHMILKRHDLTSMYVCLCTTSWHTKSKKKKNVGRWMYVHVFFYFLRAYIDRGRGEREAYTCIFLERIVITGWGVFISIHILTV